MHHPACNSRSQPVNSSRHMNPNSNAPGHCYGNTEINSRGSGKTCPVGRKMWHPEGKAAWRYNCNNYKWNGSVSRYHVENKLAELENIWNRYQHKAQQCIWKANKVPAGISWKLKTGSNTQVLNHGGLNWVNIQDLLFLFHCQYQFAIYILLSILSIFSV